MNQLLWWFAQNSLTVLIMIPCVMVVCRVFRDRPAVQHLLWLVILVKFVTPPMIAWPWSVDDVRHLLGPQDVSVHVTAIESVPVGMYPETVKPEALPMEPPLLPRELIPIQGQLDRSVIEPEMTKAVAASPLPTKQIPWDSIFTISALSVWLIGAIACFAIQLRRWRRYACLVRDGVDAPSHLIEEVASLAAQLRMKAPICTIVTGIASPFLWCVGAVRLVWPDSISSLADVLRSRGIIAHELAHLRRRDHWITWLELGVSVLWWWNPLFWLVRRRLREAAEMSCDALAIAAHPDCRHDYAQLLLQFSSQSTNGSPAPVLAVGAGNVASFERRLKMILSSNVSGKFSWNGVLVMAFLAMIALPCWSIAQSEGNAEPNEGAQKPGLVVKKTHEEVAIIEEVVGDIRYLHPPAIAQTLVVKADSWGPTVGGLKSAFLMSDIIGRSEESMLVNGALVVKNVSDEPIWFSETATIAVPGLHDEIGNQLPIEQAIFTSLIMGDRFHKSCSIVRRTILAPGEQCVLDRQCELTVYRVDRKKNGIRSVYERATVPPGKYSAMVSFTPGLRSEQEWKDIVEQSETEVALPDFYERGNVVPRSVPGEWSGSLQTGKVQFSAFDGSDASKINLSRKVAADGADNLRIRSRDGRLTFFKSAGVLRLYHQMVPHALVAFVPANDSLFISEGILAPRSMCMRSLLDISDHQLKFYDLCSGQLLAHFVPNQAGELEWKDPEKSKTAAIKPIKPANAEQTVEQNHKERPQLNVKPKADVTPSRIIKYKLVDGMTGTPLQGMEVTFGAWSKRADDAPLFSPAPSREVSTTKSAAGGLVEVSVLEGEAPYLQATPPGWFPIPQKYTEKKDGKTTEITVVLPGMPARESTEPHVVKLWPGTEISGTLLWPDGTPAANVPLRAGVYINHQSWKKRLGIDTAFYSFDHGDWPNWSTQIITDKDGHYRVSVPPSEARSWVRIGTTSLSFAAIGTPVKDSVLAKRLGKCVPLEYQIGGHTATIPAISNDLFINRNNDDRVELNLQLKRGVVVSGRVVDVDGHGLRDVRLTTTGAHGPHSGRQATSGEDGRFQFMAMPAGTLTVHPDARLRQENGQVQSREVQAVFVSQSMTIPTGVENHEITISAEPHTEVMFDWVDRREDKTQPIAYYGAFRVRGYMPDADGKPSTYWTSNTEKVERNGKTVLAVKIPRLLLKPQLILPADRRVTASYSDSTGITSGPGVVELGDINGNTTRVIYGDEPKKAK